MSEESNDITLSVVVDRQDVAWLKQKAKLEERSVSAVVRQILKALRQQELEASPLYLSSPKESGSV